MLNFEIKLTNKVAYYLYDSYIILNEDCSVSKQDIRYIIINYKCNVCYFK